MVQTLATMIMCHKIKLSMVDCLSVSRGLHTKFRFLGDESSEVSIGPFLSLYQLYCYRIPRNDFCILEHKMSTKIPMSLNCLRRKNAKLSVRESISILKYPCLLMMMYLWKGTCNYLKRKPKPCHESIKTLMARTHTARRVALLDSQYSTVASFIQEYPALKRCTYVRQYTCIATYNLT